MCVTTLSHQTRESFSRISRMIVRHGPYPPDIACFLVFLRQYVKSIIVLFVCVVSLVQFECEMLSTVPNSQCMHAWFVMDCITVLWKRWSISTQYAFLQPSTVSSAFLRLHASGPVNNCWHIYIHIHIFMRILTPTLFTRWRTNIQTTKNETSRPA